MPETNINKYVERIYNIIKNADGVKKIISELRIGDQGNTKLSANSYPLVYVTTAINPEVSRNTIVSARDVDHLPGEKRVYELWVVIVVNGPTPQDVQSSLYDITEWIISIFEKNIQLKDEDGKNPLCASSKIMKQGRLERQRGKMVEAMTIRIRPTIFIA